MRIRPLIFALFVTSFIVSLFAAEIEAPQSRNYTYGKEALTSLKASGLVKLNGTSITDNLHVMGSLIAMDAEIGVLDIMGDANLSDTIVHNNSTVMGSFQASRTTFKKPIILQGHRALLTASKLDAITVMKDPSFRGKQIIELKQHTIVCGSIHFESGNGEVILSPGSKILGSVTGGKVIKKQ